jgi:hypothetical protein
LGPAKEKYEKKTPVNISLTIFDAHFHDQKDTIEGVAHFHLQSKRKPRSGTSYFYRSAKML